MQALQSLVWFDAGTGAWHERIAEYLVHVGFCKAHADHSLYVCESDTGIVVITIYVDDLIIVGNSAMEIDCVKSLLKQEFEMKDLGELRYFLGIEVIRTPKGIDCHRGSMGWTCCPSMVWLIESQFQCPWM